MVDGIAGTGNTASNPLSNSRSTIAENFDTFLTLLTTQLKNQNPLEPVDTNAFTQQLVQFTAVEQQLKTNEYLEALVLAGQRVDDNKNDSSAQAINLIGRTVVAGSSEAELKDGEASWTYTVARDAPSAEITIRNSVGAIVFTENRELSKGQGTFAWDGEDASGLPFPDGQYSITINARDANEIPITVLTQVMGVVESVDLTGSEPIVTVNGTRLPLGSILSVALTETVTPPADTGETDETDETGDDTGTGDEGTGDAAAA